MTSPQDPNQTNEQGTGGAAEPDPQGQVGTPPPNAARLGAPPPTQPGWGTPPPPAPGWGTPPPSQPGWGTPPPPTQPGWGTPPPRPGPGHPQHASSPPGWGAAANATRLSTAALLPRLGPARMDSSAHPFKQEGLPDRCRDLPRDRGGVGRWMRRLDRAPIAGTDLKLQQDLGSRAQSVSFNWDNGVSTFSIGLAPGQERQARDITCRHRQAGYRVQLHPQRPFRDLHRTTGWLGRRNNALHLSPLLHGHGNDHGASWMVQGRRVYSPQSAGRS